MSKEEALKAHGLYLCGMSLEKIAPRFNTTRKRLWYYFKKYGLSTRAPKREKEIIYKNEKYTWSSQNNSYRKTTGKREFLQRQVWIDQNGEIPKDHDIRFIDGDKSNFSIENLLLVHKKENGVFYNSGKNQFSKRKEQDEYWHKRNNGLI